MHYGLSGIAQTLHTGFAGFHTKRLSIAAKCSNRASLGLTQTLFVAQCAQPPPTPTPPTPPPPKLQDEDKNLFLFVQEGVDESHEGHIK
jgi:hypothetical protein